jgi:hypothetical protein
VKERHKGWEDKEKDVSSYWMTLRKEQILELERRSTRTLSVEKSLWKGLWACYKADYVMTELTVWKKIILNLPVLPCL